MAAPIFGKNELEFLRRLLENRVEFMLVGLAAATLQGAPVVTQDIDIWFKDLSDPGIKRALEAVGGSYVPPSGLHPPMFAGKGLELFDIVMQLDGLGSFEEEFQNAVEFPSKKIRTPLLALERIIVSKKAADRDKDRLAILVLEDVLKTLRETR